MRTCWGPLGQAHEVHPLPLQRRVRVGAADLAVAAEQRAVCGGFWKGLPRGPGEHGPAPGRPALPAPGPACRPEAPLGQALGCVGAEAL